MSSAMLDRSFRSKVGISKVAKPVKRAIGDHVKQKILESVAKPSKSEKASPILTSAIITIVVGQEQRLFAAHEDVLVHSPVLQAACRDRFFYGNDRRIFLLDEEAEIFSCILEYLYKGDYSPRLVLDKRRNTWLLEATGTQSATAGGCVPASPSATIYHSGVKETVLRDTAVYCAAERYGLDELKRMALRKQGLQSGIEVSTIMRSARYAYDHTPETDSRLRAHYLALIIRSRKTFKRSGTMQTEMESGGKLLFDLFVAMCNHMDDLEYAAHSRGTRKTI